MQPSYRVVLVLAALALASTAAAHHRQTDPVVALTLSGDTPLPRVATPGKKTLTLAVQFGAGRRIVSVSPFQSGQSPAEQTIIADAGDWDRSLGTNAPGQSGDPDDPHYRDLFGSWASGNYFPVFYSRPRVESVTESRTVLVPAR